VHVLLATDADYVIDEVTAALGGPDVSFTVCRNGRDVSPIIAQRQPDLAVLDLQIGSMGAMAVTLALRLDESASGSERTKVLMLLDRQADVHLAKRCDADGWLVKPMNPLALRRAANAILHPPAEVIEPTVTSDAEVADDGQPADVTA
jgi:two-component system nitrate/nitrite response regulator NarL